MTTCKKKEEILRLCGFKVTKRERGGYDYHPLLLFDRNPKIHNTTNKQMFVMCDSEKTVLK